MTKKGLELPINILVVVAVAVIVLLGIIAMYVLGIGPFTANIGLEAIKNAGCAELQRAQCAINTDTIDINFDADNSGYVCNKASPEYDNQLGKCKEADNTLHVRDTLALLCSEKYHRTGESACKALCACPGYV